MDFSMLDLNGDGSYIYQPQVFSVLEMPEVAIDTTVLSGKTSNFVGKSSDCDEEKIEVPVIERMPVIKEEVVSEAAPIDEEFDANPAFALFSDASSPVTSQLPIDLDITSIFGGIEPEKALARFDLVDATESGAIATNAMARVSRICVSLDAVTARLEAMTVGL